MAIRFSEEMNFQTKYSKFYLFQVEKKKFNTNILLFIFLFKLQEKVFLFFLISRFISLANGQ